MDVDTKEMDRLEALAEQSYTAMYDARRPKDGYEDACLNFQRAIDEAHRIGLEDEAARLTRRLDHVRAVYRSQFRGF
jgi:hypothetical protein